MIDDGKAGLKNEIHPCRSAPSAAIAMLIRHLVGAPLYGGHDECLQASACPLQQSPFDDDRRTAPWLGVLVFFQLYGMSFCLKGAVLDFNRLVELTVSPPRADAMFQELLSWLGFAMDPEKRQPPAGLILCLGTFVTVEILIFLGCSRNWAT